MKLYVINAAAHAINSCLNRIAAHAGVQQGPAAYHLETYMERNGNVWSVTVRDGEHWITNATRIY